MNLISIETLAHNRRKARYEELRWKQTLARITADLEQTKNQVLASAYEEGLVNGKNADARKRQEADVLINDQAVQNRTEDVTKAEDHALDAQVEREYYDDVVSLTKAWLYSQKGE